MELALKNDVVSGQNIKKHSSLAIGITFPVYLIGIFGAVAVIAAGGLGNGYNSA
jgi:hypothetical protein